MLFKVFMVTLLCVSGMVRAGELPPPESQMNGVVNGEVLEVKRVSSFTYMRLMTSEGEKWAAVVNTPAQVGAHVTIENVTVMKDFKSKALHKTFTSIVFGTLAGADRVGGIATDEKQVSMTNSDMDRRTQPEHALGNAYATLPAPKQEAPDEYISRARGPHAHTVAEIIRQAGELQDKTVEVRGKVVKYNPDIMGRNWLHLRDGSGSAKDNSNDILVTSKDESQLGAIVTVKGIVHINKDFGAGYIYKVLIENAGLE